MSDQGLDLRRLKLALPAPALHVVQLLWMIAVVGLAVYGQRLLDAKVRTGRGFIALGLAALGFALLFRRVALERPADSTTKRTRPSLWLLPASAFLAVPAFFAFSGNRLTALGVALWLSSLVISLIAVSDATPAEGRAWLRERMAQGGIRLSWSTVALTVALLIISGVGAFLRVFRLDQVPAEMGTDLPLIYQNIDLILQGNYQIFFPIYPGREGLFFYLAAVHAAWFGLSHFGILFTSAMIGVLTIPAIYFLATELFNREVGLYAAGFVAVSRWHVIMSRTGLRAILVPLFIVLMGYFLARAVRGRRWLDWGLAGLFLGLGMHTYNGFMTVPLALILFLVWYALIQRDFLRQAIGPVAIMVFISLLAFLPLGRYAYEQPDSYLFRVATRVSSLERPLPRDVLTTFVDNLRRSLLMFNYVGDAVPYNNIPFQRQLGFASGVLFVLGLAYLLGRIRHDRNAWAPMFLGVMILPTALSLAFPHEVPGALRASGAVPPAFLAVAVALCLLRRRLTTLVDGAMRRLYTAVQMRLVGGWRSRPRRSVVGGVIALLAVAIIAWEGAATYEAYFGVYRENLWRGNYSISEAMADTTVDFEGAGPVYVKGWPHMYDGHALQAQLEMQSGHGGWEDVEVTELRPDAPPLSELEEGKALFIISPEDEEARAALHAAFPTAIEIVHRDYDGRPAFVEFIGEK